MEKLSKQMNTRSFTGHCSHPWTSHRQQCLVFGCYGDANKVNVSDSDLGVVVLQEGQPVTKASIALRQEGNAI